MTQLFCFNFVVSWPQMNPLPRFLPSIFLCNWCSGLMNSQLCRLCFLATIRNSLFGSNSMNSLTAEKRRDLILHIFMGLVGSGVSFNLCRFVKDITVNWKWLTTTPHLVILVERFLIEVNIEVDCDCYHVLWILFFLITL